MRFFIICFTLLLVHCNLLICGTLVEVSGIDGAGKTTFAEDLSNALSKKGKNVIVLRPLRGDPSFYPFLDKIESLKSTNKKDQFHQRVERFKNDFFLLSFIDTKQLIDEYLTKYDFVICDRYIFSFRTYQECFGESDDENLLNELPKTNVTILITAPIDIVMERINGRKKAFAYENAIFLEKAQHLFMKNAFKYDNLLRLEGNETRESNTKKALLALDEYL